MTHPAHAVVLGARSLQDRAADVITDFVGSMSFVYLHACWFALWIVGGIESFPYGFLTMLVSLEAIFLSTFVMISQNRQSTFQAARADHDHELLKKIATRLGVEA